MSSGLFSIGSSALTAAYAALQTTGNNIANANTPGYSRQIVDFSAQVETNLSGNYIGEGVAVASIHRAYDELLTRQVESAQAAASQTGTRATLLNQVSNLFASTTSGLGAAVNQFFAQMQTLTQQPSSLAVRQTALSSAQQMAASFNDAYARLQQMQQSANQQIGQEISTVNSTSAQIARLNDQIALAT
jgi:flagellar hook-associated protein 1 FlgK